MYIRIDNRKIHYKILGKGSPIIMVHGWGGTLYSLHPLALHASRTHTVYLLDLPGFGKSDNPPPHWGVEGYADLVYRFITTVNIEHPIYVGHSFGGSIGIYLASHYPTLFTSLILCNSAYKREMRVSFTARVFKRIPSSFRTIVAPIEPIVKKLYYRLFHKSSDLMRYPHLEANFRKIIIQDLSGEATKITIPTCIIWGENDTYTPVVWGYELEKLIQGSRIKVFPQTRHNLPLKFPQEVWGEIAAFLSTH